jgi:uncharacterized RDD family membrane protein YckC
MKCQNCGYVSFDDVPTCKECGTAIEEGDRAEAEPASDLQNELFSPRLEEAGQEQVVTSGEEVQEPEQEAVELPDMHVDYDPAVEPEDDETPSGHGHEYAAGPDAHTEEIIDDDTELPDDLWLEESAGFLFRLGASAIDGFILAVILGIFGFGALVALGPGERGLSVFSDPGVFIAFYLLALLLSLGYFTFFLGWTGRSPGKVLLKLDVRRSDGAPMTYTRAFLRWAGYLVSLTFAGLGFFWVLFDERKRGWHDYLSGTWVKDLRHDA